MLDKNAFWAANRRNAETIERLERENWLLRDQVERLQRDQEPLLERIHNSEVLLRGRPPYCPRHRMVWLVRAPGDIVCTSCESEMTAMKAPEQHHEA